MTGPRANALLLSFGAVTAIGASAERSVASARCGQSGICIVDELRSTRNGEPLRLAPVPILDPGLSAVARMESLAWAALQQVVPCLTALRCEDVPVLLSVPSPRPGFSIADGVRLARDLLKQLPVPVSPSRSGIYCSGQDGGLAALRYAQQLFATQQADACLIGGVESCWDREFLSWLEAQQRLLGAGEPHGFIPGEASGFLCVASPRLVSALSSAPLAVLEETALEGEPRPWFQGRATAGQGLTRALWRVLRDDRPGPRRADVTYTDLNGERWRTDEWSFAYLRTGKLHGEPLDLRHPADCWGDVGAATSPLLLGLAAVDLARGWDEHASALVCASAAATPARAACLVTRVSAESEDGP